MSLLRSYSLTGVDFSRLQQTPQPLGIQAFVNFNNIQCPAEVKKFIPHTAQFIYNYIANKANSNWFRGVHFNMLVSDNMNNPELTILTTYVLNLSYIYIKEGRFNNAEAAITQTAAWAIDRRINFISINDANLSQAAQDNIQAIREFAVEYVTEAEKVENLLANQYMGGTVNANIGFGGNNNQNNGFGNNTNTGMSGFGESFGGFGGMGNQPSGFSNGGGMTGFGRSNNQNSIGNVITRVDNNGANQVRESTVGRDLFHVDPAPKPSVQDIVQPKAVVQQEQPKKQQPVQNSGKIEYYKPDGTPNTDVLEIVDAPWYTSPYQPYMVAYDSRKYAAVFKKLPSQDGSKVYIIASLTKAPKMDRSAHALPISDQFMSTVMPERVGSVVVNKREDYKEVSLKTAGDNVQKINNMQECEYVERLDEVRSRGLIAWTERVFSVQEMLCYSRRMALKYMGNEYGVYSVDFKLTKELAIRRGDLRDILHIQNSPNFASVCKKLTFIMEDSSASQSCRTAAMQLNAYLADKFLDFVKFFLCVDDYEASNSFIDDHGQILEDIGKFYGSNYKQVMLDNQQHFLETYLKFGDHYENDICEVSDPEEKTKAEETPEDILILPIETRCFISCTEFIDSEYSLKIPPNTGAMFTPQTTSDGLYKLASAMVERTKSVELQGKIHRYFIATLDDRIFEVAKGIGENSPLLIRRFR